jgi:hypothetical protein
LDYAVPELPTRFGAPSIPASTRRSRPDSAIVGKTAPGGRSFRTEDDAFTALYPPCDSMHDRHPSRQLVSRSEQPESQSRPPPRLPLPRDPNERENQRLCRSHLSLEARFADACVIGIRPNSVPFRGGSGISRSYTHLGLCRLIGLPEAFSAYGPGLTHWRRLLCRQ